MQQKNSGALSVLKKMRKCGFRSKTSKILNNRRRKGRKKLSA